jgi:hypothetical protein
MTEDEVVRILCEHFESLFPKVCPSCDRCFLSLQEYILVTIRVGPSVSYDAAMGDWQTRQPIGTVVMANCSCGSTLTLSTKTMVLARRLAILNWVRTETQQRGVSPSELLEYLRDKVRKRVLGDAISG